MHTSFRIFILSAVATLLMSASAFAATTTIAVDDYLFASNIDSYLTESDNVPEGLWDVTYVGKEAGDHNFWYSSTSNKPLLQNRSNAHQTILDVELVGSIFEDKTQGKGKNRPTASITDSAYVKIFTVTSAFEMNGVLFAVERQADRLQRFRFRRRGFRRYGSQGLRRHAYSRRGLAARFRPARPDRPA